MATVVVAAVSNAVSIQSLLLWSISTILVLAAAWTISWWVSASLTSPMSWLVEDVGEIAGAIERGTLRVAWPKRTYMVAEVRAVRLEIDRLTSVIRAQAARRTVTTAMLAHDMRTPLLGAVREVLHLADLESGDLARQADLGRIANELVTVLTLVDQSVDLERFGRLDVPFAKTDVQIADDVVSPVVERLRSLVRDKDLIVEILDRGIIKTDPLAIQRALHNLLTNALRAARRNVTITVFAGGVRVKDDGDGLPRSLSELIAPFAVGMATVISPIQTPNVGLGLHIADSIARASGGRLVLESTGATGTTLLLYVGSHA